MPRLKSNRLKATRLCAHCGESFHPHRISPRQQRYCKLQCWHQARRRSMRERFERYVDHRDAESCWPWTGPLTTGGYGALRDFIDGKNKLFTASRLAWEYANGPIPDGLWVLHVCDRPSCCNPAHLRLGTHQDNMDDAAHKGRMRRGEGKSQSKLTEDAVRIIRASTELQSVLAERFGVARNTISQIQNRYTWRHLP